MRVAVLSDIHANYAALLSVLNDAVQEGVSQVWYLGDVAGYGPYALECYEELKTLEARWHISLSAWLAGNHDWGLTGRIPLEARHFSQLSQWSLLRTIDRAKRSEEALFKEMSAELDKLPTFTESPQAGVWLMHGRVRMDERGNIDEIDNITGDSSYIWWEAQDGWKVDQSWRVMAGLAEGETHRPGIILGGHTHVPLLWCRLDDGSWRAELPPQKGRPPPKDWTCPKCGRTGPCRSIRRWGEPIHLPNTPVLINPGSVGFPRDDCPAAAYVILDFEGYKTRVTFKRVGYDVRVTQGALVALARQPDGSYDQAALRQHVHSLREWLRSGTLAEQDGGA